MAAVLTSAEPIGLDHVLADPRDAARLLLTAGLYGVTGVEVRQADRDCVVFWVTLAPWAPMAERGYPTERVGIMVQANGEIAAVPHLAANRSWLHRYPDALGELCLWYPGDPPALQWSWANGLADFVTIVHRHIQAEEYFRREGVWPSEDAPHGPGLHPIRTLALRLVAGQGLPR